MKAKKDGFYMAISEEDRKLIAILKKKYAVNISQAFKLFLRGALAKLERQ
jgi:hypothetical protein